MGTRASNLALIQTRGVIERFRRILPDAEFEEVQFSSPGDRDRVTDLRDSPPDFFTRDLDEAMLAGGLDCAVHSAKDLPYPPPAGLDWCWLPWREDARDAVILPKGRPLSALPAAPLVGISSARREAYTRRRFPDARMAPIRGNIQERLAQLDAGRYDAIIMAGAALVRLGLEDRVTDWIPLADLPAPEGQGALALTFRDGDERFLRLRSLFVKAVTFVGAGTGDAGACTVAGREALGCCEVCLHDSLMDPALLDALPAAARRVDAGKRCGDHGHTQPEINAAIADFARKGLRVVRLKGGDAGIFGRLAEEVETLDRLHLPYRVLPGVSSLNAATTGTGMLLTRRGVSRGFCAMTPRRQGGGSGPIGAAERGRLPVVFFMAVTLVRDVTRQLLADGTPADCPAAAVFNAGRDDEAIVRAEVGTLAETVEAAMRRPGGERAWSEETPGLLIVGEVARHTYNRGWGVLMGRRILLTCSSDLLDKAVRAVHDLGGRPVCRPLIRLVPDEQAVDRIRRLGDYDWVVITSPAAVRCFVEVLDRCGADLRSVPSLMACGPGTSRELRKYRLLPKAEPAAEFGAKGLERIARHIVKPGVRVLRLRSDRAGGDLAAALSGMGAAVDDCVLYRNERLSHDACPAFDAAFFASASAVEAFGALWGMEALKGKTLAAIGKPTAEALRAGGLSADVVGPEATVDDCLGALAVAYLRQAMEELI